MRVWGIWHFKIETLGRSLAASLDKGSVWFASSTVHIEMQLGNQEKAGQTISQQPLLYSLFSEFLFDAFG